MPLGNGGLEEVRSRSEKRAGVGWEERGAERRGSGSVKRAMNCVAGQRRQTICNTRTVTAFHSASLNRIRMCFSPPKSQAKLPRKKNVNAAGHARQQSKPKTEMNQNKAATLDKHSSAVRVPRGPTLHVDGGQNPGLDGGI